MYSIVLLAALSSGEQAPAHGWKKNFGYCYGACYGMCYAGWEGGVHAVGGWGQPYGGYWAGYACYGACGGYESAAYGMPVPTISPAPSTYAPIEEKPADMKKANDNETKPIEKLDDGDNSQVRAKVIFDLPRGAKLYVDDHLIERTDSDKTFRTPALNRNEQYFYDLRVEVIRNGKKLVESKRVTLRAGDVIQADFSKVGSETGVASVGSR